MVVSADVTPPCHRTRSLVSAGLDGPLNDLEQHFVTTHLGRCAACRAFEEDARAFTTLLRDAPLEEVSWPAAVADRGRRKPVRFRTIAQIASVASVMVAAGTIALAQEFPGATGETTALSAGAAGFSASEASIRSLRREALVQHQLPILPVDSAPDNSGSVTQLKPALPVDGS